MKKMRTCVRIYVWLNNTFVEKIMLKNYKEELEALKTRFAKGHTHIPLELEAIMEIESVELIKNHFDNKNGAKEMTNMIIKHALSKESIITDTHLLHKIKLKDLKQTWEFTRPWQMFYHYIETLFYILISQTSQITYLAMIFSMY
jgi:hypothetical protein